MSTKWYVIWTKKKQEEILRKLEENGFAWGYLTPRQNIDEILVEDSFCYLDIETNNKKCSFYIYTYIPIFSKIKVCAEIF